MAKVFVSYSRKDIQFAKRLTAELQKCELDFWIDWEGIPPTVDWWKEIEKGIEEADIFLFLISPDSAASKVCGQEIDTAVKNAKRIIPLVVRDLKGDEAPRQLSHLNWIFVRETDDFEAAFQKLLTGIHTDYEWVQEHRWLQVRALDWQRENKDKGALLRGKDLQDAEFQLATNTSKEPHPTDLQREYVFESRKAVDRQRRLTTSIAIAGAIALAALAIFGFVQAKLASDRANIALARQLASQAQLLYTNKSSKQLTASLLSIQSLKLYPNGDAADFLLNNNLETRPVITINSGGEIESISYSPDGKYLAATVCDSKPKGNCIWSLRVWDAKSGREMVHSTQMNGFVYRFIFEPDSRYIVFEECSSFDEDSYSCMHKLVHVVEISTGRLLNSIDTTRIGPFLLSPDGKRMAGEFSEQKSFALWDTFTGKELARIDYTDSIVLSPNLRDIANLECSQFDDNGSCSQGVIRVREIPSNQEVARIDTAYADSTVVFSPNGEYIAASGSAGTGIWETATGKEMFRKPLIYRRPPGVSIAFSPKGERVIAASGTTAEVWEVSTGKEVSRLTDDASFNEHITFSPDGKYALMGNLAGLINVWDLTTGVKTELPHDSEDFIFSASFSPDGKYVVSAGDDGTARVLETATGKEIARMTHNNKVRATAFSPNGQSVVSTGYDGTVRVWKPMINEQASHGSFQPQSFVGLIKDKFIISPECNKYNKDGACAEGGLSTREISSGKEISVIPFEDVISKFSPDGRYAASVNCLQSNDSSGCLQTRIQIWDVRTGKGLGHLLQDGDLSADNVTFSPKGSFVASRTSDDSEVLVWDPVTANEVMRMKTEMDDPLLTNFDPVYVMTFTPDEKYLIAQQTGYDGSDKAVSFIFVWNIASGKELTQFRIDQSIKSFAVSADGRYMIFGHDDDASLWELATGKEVSRMTHDKVEDFSYQRVYGVLSVAFSPDGKYVVTGSGDQTARVWEAVTRKEIARVTHEDVVSNVAMSPDGKFVASVSVDGVLRVWEAFTGREITRNKINGCSGCFPYMNLFSFSPDGRYIVADGRVLIWQPADIIKSACMFMPRNLTRVEWAQFIGEAIPYQAVCPDLPIEQEGALTPTAAP
ncbi:MAG TPA: TIR domain-containing protein [Anaerolineales bacterium]|nr:TIR domain-containing protein [Anaerolineales bacterium]